MRESDIVHENGRYWVLRDVKHVAYTVYISGITHSTSHSSYPLTDDGLLLAKACADYWAGRDKENTNDT